ncbi:hypothetical protein PV08_00052 [Exophiala spinifera]|uniref:3-hydroxyisobutyrate dehydrogenase n=1 Tax=Exophiala spinifera TaxID=91928 RepID=A0A0D2BLP4_9EURO|nr:uncharacterized protein PV08_00052 [Exophiala spinifera]KIW19480.1 hypothetical protein PV08_00052 [Exophiala spinifera]
MASIGISSSPLPPPLASSSSSSSNKLPSHLGFVGLGVMGFAMFCNLARKVPAGSTVHFYDVNPDSMERAAREPGLVAQLDRCSCAREVAEKSEVLISMVPQGKHVRAVYLDPENGVLAATDLSGKILLDSSTIDTTTSLLVGEETRKRHGGGGAAAAAAATFYDAPVSGGSLGARNATITFMVGCAESDPNMPLLRELFGLMGRNTFACGGPSLGLVAKLCNNYLSFATTLANAEMFNLAIRSGMDPGILRDILKTSSGGNRNAQVENPVPGLNPDAPASNGYRPGFAIEYVKKDIELAMDACDRVGAKVCMGRSIRDAYLAASLHEGNAGMDSKIVYRWMGGEEDWKGKLGL